MPSAPAPAGPRPTRSYRFEPVRAWVGLVLLALGVLWLLDAADVLGAGELLDRWWPAAVLLLAVLAALADRRLALGPSVLAVLGALLLVDQLDLVDLGAVLWRLLAVVAGGFLLARATGRPRRVVAGASDRSDVVAVLGGAETVVRSRPFRHATVSALLGGAVLDLREAEVQAGARVDALALFGGVDVVVPPGWRVTLSGLPVFGGFEDKTGADGPPPPGAPVLDVHATALFGGVEVKNRPD
ncbi:hypothetical protein TEK04_06260 [Klenkia sp. LSe6-5]|uniref:LiaF transmembrane domain-containing protein n=1 Tax=Klenkia sesuvii TaxID=3103137 RepID=A0ABU8DRL2_9ACTN